MAIYSLQPPQLFSVTLCKYPFSLFSYFSSDICTSSPTKHTLQQPRYSPPRALGVRPILTHFQTKSFSTDQEISRNTSKHKAGNDIGSGVSSFRPRNKRAKKKPIKDEVGLLMKDNMKSKNVLPKKASVNLDSGSRRKLVPDPEFLSSKVENGAHNASKSNNSRTSVNRQGQRDRSLDKGDSNLVREEKLEKKSRKMKVESPGLMLRVGLDMCSKRGDVMGAIRLYDLVLREGASMGQYHYAVLLYLCSSAATGVVQPAKSGKNNRSLSSMDSSNKLSGSGFENLDKDEDMGILVKHNEIHEKSVSGDLNVDTFPAHLVQSFNGSMTVQAQTMDELIQFMNSDNQSSNARYMDNILHNGGIEISEESRKYALERGFEIYEKMCLEKVPMNETILTSVARMAMAMNNGDLAFDTVKQMTALGINPRLRSYGPALSVYCSNGDIEEAFLVEEHMLEHGVHPEEPELEALFRVSIETGRTEKVYYLLHKLRTIVRQVSPSIADLIEKWFNSKVASRVGKIKWDEALILKAIENVGGGWHGQGWLGKGKWTISRTSVSSDGLCNCCGEKLAIIDLDPKQTENFAESVASIAVQREKSTSFQKFQKWLDYYGPFEAVVDGANVGLFSQRKLKPSKINAVVNGIRQMLPSKKWPLIVLHNKRITGDKMDEPINKALVEKWRNADALYATSTGSNDDWYWLYAAIKSKCLIVTNDEMRDHLFQLLGNDFFPKWKERHQVRFSFSDMGPVFFMPPPCSVVIQESKEGHWHIPVVSEGTSEGARTWLCITRSTSKAQRQYFAPQNEGMHHHHDKRHARTEPQTKTRVNQPKLENDRDESIKHPPKDIDRNLRNILSSTVAESHSKILQEIEAAEKLGGCIIDFQI